MKNTLKEKFKNNVIVKPLYRKLKDGNKVEPTVLVTVDRTFKLDGHAITVKRNIVNDNDNTVSNKAKTSNRVFRCVRDQSNQSDIFEKINHERKINGLRKTYKMLSGMENKRPSEVDDVDDGTNKLVQADYNHILVTQTGNAWLRFHPLPKVSGESLRSVVFRCIFCQLGLFTVLILWSIVWVFVIQSFEGPNEIIVTRNYENEQNQLVIELATELRQITPLSPKWKRAIARRLQDEKQLTIQAVSQGARIHPGQYWDLSGTFLFVVYVMTALGFGAPVPQTLWGRSAALIYAFFAIPTHIYLMLNSSMCFVVHVERYMIRLKSKLRDKRPFVLGKTAVQNGTGSPNCSRSSEVLKSPNRSGVATKIMRLICVLGACRSVPLAAVLYYLFGVAAFGFARGSSYMDALLFPLEFTTSGGLNQVK
ncbi:uncharacterized protein LOC113491849 isoform X2 [Trichoplusia ni]|nr:uncharacterized protein LOC113491849 isoform X2 [Trichoplusia ni]